ncbi:MAG TPA: homogentisate 1,2-dioxygenase [Candidatus Krumholzibacteria bacterium]|jgi:homogentisate 1,2-dioxygenase
MPIYHSLGRIPRKRHQVFRKSDGGIYYEELVGNKGFTGLSSLLYHIHPPTEVSKIETLCDLRPVAAEDGELRHRHYATRDLPRGGSPVFDRVPLLFNADVSLWHAAPDRHDEDFFRNGQADELVYLAQGRGVLESQYGSLEVRDGDYVVIPRGIVHRWRLDSERPATMLILESSGALRTPRRYRNEHGQLLEGAPFNERDIRRPAELDVHDEAGSFGIVVKHDHKLLRYTLTHHPCDAVGWDGFYYPWAFSIHDFEPLVGRFHQPPPIHQTFEGDGFVVCSFCPRPFDFDEEAVPAPYFHTNAMTDEVIFYASSEFMSRKGVSFGSITLHPDGISHGPQPGRMEASIGKKWTDELAVMVDTYRPLQRARAIADIEDADYWKSWIDKE